jgi:NAD(P) transhydrogenase
VTGSAEELHFDVVVVGSGPAGQKASIQSAKAGRSVCIVEQEVDVGGACVHRGTIPSKTLRETARHLSELRRRLGRHLRFEVPRDLQLASLMERMDGVVKANVEYQSRQLLRNGVTRIHGRARFLDPHAFEVTTTRRDTQIVRGDLVVLAPGSRPRCPDDVPVDHEHVYDSDSILSMSYLPESLTVLGSGVIATEYATIFAALGVEVTMIDRAARPLAFLDRELTDRLLAAFERHEGCTFVREAKVASVAWNGVDKVVTRLANGWTVASEKVLCALGRVANVEGLAIERAGLAINRSGHLPVDKDGRTAVPHIFAVGDVVGQPSLASAAMEQGRRAVRAALELPRPAGGDLIPTGVYALPEIGSIGLDEQAAIAAGLDVVVGRANFAEIARGHINGNEDGLLKLVVDAATRRIAGCQVVGEGATELVHVAQMAMAAEAEVDTFVERVFNFPTMAEAYRVAALDAVGRIDARRAPVAP